MASRIPFDSFTLAAVVRELQAFVGGKVQGIRQPNETDIAIGLYAGGGEGMLLLSCDPNFARAYLITKRPGTIPNPPAFLSALRSRLEGARVAAVRQIQGDRLMEILFETSHGDYRLIAELMGKHSNLILVEPGGRVLAAAKWVGKSKSSRPVISGTPYEWPPVLEGGEDLKPSPFYKTLAAVLGHAPVADQAVIVTGQGAYPTSVAALGYTEFTRSSISVALEQYFGQAIPVAWAESLRATLVTGLNRIILAREVALSDLRQAEEAGGRAPTWQRYGELLMAYGTMIRGGVETAEVWDYEGNPLSIKVDPELDYKENANRYFERAKKAKRAMGLVRDQIDRLSADRADLLDHLRRVEAAERLETLRELQEEARRRKWLMAMAVPAKNKEDRPYEGHRIRELAAPGGWTVLFGENAASNDYLTLRVARPSDWWLHIRGATSAHVVIVTRNQPERVQRETLEFAAKVAVQNSPSKHAGYVAVDYTLRRYVRRPKGAPKGTALYTHEKTLHIES